MIILKNMDLFSCNNYNDNKYKIIIGGNKLRKFLKTTIFFSVFLLISPNVRAENFIDNQTVDTNKTWSIKFSDDIKLDDLTKSGVMVTDSKGNMIAVDVQLGESNKIITITAPKGGYSLGEGYILNIDTKIHSNSGKALKNECKFHFNIKSSDEVVTFKDKNLEQQIRDNINKPTGNIYKSDVEKITHLKADNENIQDISGIENLVNLKKLSLTGNKITNLKPLKDMINLTNLNLDNNEINDISVLRNLTNLTRLTLCHNKITNLDSLKNLSKLQILSLSENEVTDISPLKEFSNLNTLYLAYNKINDLTPLKELSNLNVLYLQYNNFKNVVPLKSLDKLSQLILDSNEVNKSDEEQLSKSLQMCGVIVIP